MERKLTQCIITALNHLPLRKLRPLERVRIDMIFIYRYKKVDPTSSCKGRTDLYKKSDLYYVHIKAAHNDSYTGTLNMIFFKANKGKLTSSYKRVEMRSSLLYSKVELTWHV